MELDGHKRLRKWLKRTKTTPLKLSQRAGISMAQLSHLIHGRRKASLVVAVKLQRATEGEVPAASWVSL